MSDLPENIDGRIGHDVVIIDGAGQKVEGRLVAYSAHPSVIIEHAGGMRVAYPVTMVQQRPLRERVAELLDEEHGRWVSEGGCDFRAFNRPSRPGGEESYNSVVDRIIELVRSAAFEPERGDQATCKLCGGDIVYTTSGWQHAPGMHVGSPHEAVVA